MSGIIFYDGECGFCNRWVQFYLKNEKDFELMGSRPSFSPLQGDAAAKLIPEETDLSSIIYLEGGKVYRKSTAVLRIMKNMKCLYRILSCVGNIIPRCLRDVAYDCVAKRRQILASPYCHIPTKEEKARFLD